MATDCRRCFPKIFLRFPHFPGRGKSKCLGISVISQLFQKYLIDYHTMILQKKSVTRQWLQQKIGFMEEIENIEYLWHYATDFFHSFRMCLGNIWLLNKNY